MNLSLLGFLIYSVAGRRLDEIRSSEAATVRGVCHAGDPFTIDSAADIFSHLEDLECLFAAGVAPTAPPLGYAYGTLLLATNTALLDPISRPFYQGDYVVQTKCAADLVNVGVLSVAGVPLGTAEWLVGPFPGTVAEGEAPLNGNLLVMDFRVNFHERCPPAPSEAGKHTAGMFPFKNSPPPLKSFVDVGRIVGRDSSDGSLLFLNKALIGDDARGFSTVLFYIVKTFDDNGVAVPSPLVVPTTFSFARPGVRSIVERVPSIVVSLGQFVQENIRALFP